jgi:MYXO-CTERM domain-containing protein
MRSGLGLAPVRGARFLVAGLAFTLIAFASAAGRAHTGEFVHGIALHPTDPRVFVARYEAGYGGLLYSRDGGSSVQIVPGLAFQMYPLRWRVPMLMTGDGKLLLSLDTELRIDDGTGCKLSAAEPALDKAWIADLTPHPSDPGVAFALTAAGGSTDKHAGLWKRDAAGVLAPFGASDVPTVTLGQVPFRATSLKVVARAASMDGLRFVEAGMLSDANAPQTRNPVLRISDDLGATWTTHAIPDTTASKGVPIVLLVSGADPLQALVALETGTGDDEKEPNDPIYLTRDGGQSFTLYLDQIQTSGEAVLLPSGQILIGDRGVPGGLWSAPSFGAAASKIQPWRVHCLGYQKTSEKIVMCTRHEIGFYDASSNSFCAFFAMDEVSGMASCPAAPYELNAKATEQLCGNYCTAQHFAAARVCETFDVGNATLCGQAARAYDADIEYIAPPGASASPRCSGFAKPPLPEAGVRDAGVDAGDASAASEDDAGSDDAGDDEDSAEEEENDEDAAVDDEESDASDDEMRKKKKKGCACALGAPDAPLAEGLPLVLLAGVLGLRLRRRRH